MEEKKMTTDEFMETMKPNTIYELKEQRPLTNDELKEMLHLDSDCNKEFKLTPFEIGYGITIFAFAVYGVHSAYNSILGFVRRKVNPDKELLNEIEKLKKRYLLNQEKTMDEVETEEEGA